MVINVVLLISVFRIEVILAQKLNEKCDNLLQDDHLEVLLHLSCLLRGQILKELANADFDALLATVHHVQS